MYCQIGIMKVQTRIGHVSEVSNGADVVGHYTRYLQIGSTKVQKRIGHVGKV